MPDSIITQCPNCSTTFRVSDDVLKMARGKVRCGQCFHIFAAQPHESNNELNELRHTPVTDSTNKDLTSNVSQAAPQKKEPVEPPTPPEWLDLLVESENNATDEDDLSHLTPYQRRVLSERKQLQAQEAKQDKEPEPEKAPWERELEELEAIQKAASQKKPEIASKKAKVETSSLAKKAPSLETLPDEAFQQVRTEHEHSHPEYMQALQQLAQTGQQQEASAEQYKKDAQQRLSELIEESPEQPQPPKPKSHTLFWFTTSVMASVILIVQLLYFNFDQGSRSTTFRPIYKIVCSYSGCVLPTFEDVSSIDIQYVRVQSHPTESNALLVNAIMTNTSPFSQPMPKLALEFFDLNGKPIAARLFSQNNFLDKDFLDITYMPPNTPIHLVISIADPGAAAVTHQLTAYRASTRSF